MANVAFKWGNSSGLHALSSASNGTFYLTKDTHKLYVGINNEFVDLTHFINYVATQSALNSVNAEVGDIYYITEENILCIKNNGAGWTQINPNTTLDADVGGAVAVAAVTSGVSVTTTVQDTASNEVSGSFSIIEGNSNIHISRSGNTISISSDNNADDHIYSLGTNLNSSAGVVKLTPSLGGNTLTPEIVTFNGSGRASVESTSSGVVTITVPEQDISTELSFSSSGVLTAESTLVAQGTNSDTSVTPTIKYGAPATTGGVRPTSAVFASGVADLDVYTTSQVDTLISNAASAMNAMTYKGVVSNAADAATKLVTTANVGDTYKAQSAFTYNGISYKAGDLIIASGTDGNVTWDVVPSGDDYRLLGEVTSSNFTLTDEISNDTFLDVTLVSSTSTARAAINVVGNVTSTASPGGAVTYTFSHGDKVTGTAVNFPSSATSSQASGTATSASILNIPVITAISQDEVGHVTNIQTGLYSVVDSHNYVNLVDLNTSVSSSQAVISVAVQDHDGGGDSDAIALTTTNESIVYTSTNITSGQDTYQAVQIDLVWGEF